MTRKYVFRYAAILMIVWMGVLTGSAYCQPAEQSAQQAIEKSLAEKGTFELANVPLSRFITLLREKYGMNVILDERALKEKGIDGDSPVSIKLKDVSVHSALELALRQLGLTWTIYCEALVISLPGGIQNMQYTQLYDITDLGTVVGDQGKKWEDPEALVESITTAVAPESWDGAGGHGTIQLVSTGAARLLVVSQDYRVQREIARLLSGLHDVAKQHAAPAREKSVPGR